MSLPPPTPKQASLSAADEIFLETWTPESATELRGVRRQNDAKYPGVVPSAAAKKKSSKPWKPDPNAVRIYDGYEGLLVRTALLRQPGYEKIPPVQVTSGSDVYRLLNHLAFADQEHFIVLSLNNRNEVQSIYEAGIGGAFGVAVSVRDVVKTVILSGGISAILAHNHPSGDPTPSREDVLMTKQTAKAFSFLGYKILDHIIVARSGFTSFYEKGILPSGDD